MTTCFGKALAGLTMWVAPLRWHLTPPAPLGQEQGQGAEGARALRGAGVIPRLLRLLGPSAPARYVEPAAAAVAVMVRDDADCCEAMLHAQGAAALVPLLANPSSAAAVSAASALGALAVRQFALSGPQLLIASQKWIPPRVCPHPTIRTAWSWGMADAFLCDWVQTYSVAAGQRPALKWISSCPTSMVAVTGPFA